ncbi:hypothetical protein M8C21_015712, partial [Ambrosia artemisiifolia]
YLIQTQRSFISVHQRFELKTAANRFTVTVLLQNEKKLEPGDSRKFAMKALKSYVKDLDSKAIPIFLAQVSETKETGLTSGEYTISLYEVLARVHGPKIVPQIDNIMLTIIKTLTSSAGSFALHQACSKVVPAIARYGMDPTTPDAKKSEIIHSLCKPLSDSLLSSQENLSSGAALCLKALVESDNWRFSSSQMVNEVCQRVAAALEKPMQANSHIGLVMALAKHNGSDVEGYARLLIRAGVGILNMGVNEGNSQKRLSAIQMVNFLMRSLDYKCLMSELHYVIEEFQKCQNDQMAYVKGAAFEAIQTAKRILTEKGSKREHRSRSVSPRPQTIHSFGEYGSSISYSPITTSFASRDDDSESRSINRKLWSRVDRSRSYVNVNNTDIFTTPKKLVKSLQVSNSDCSENQSRRFRSPASSKFNWSPNSSYDHSGFDESFTNENEQFNGASESVSSTEDIPANGSNNLQVSQEPVPETKVKSNVQISPAISIASGLFVLLIAVVCFMWMRDLDDGYNNLVPT